MNMEPPGELRSSGILSETMILESRIASALDADGVVTFGSDGNDDGDGDCEMERLLTSQEATTIASPGKSDSSTIRDRRKMGNSNANGKTTVAGDVGGNERRKKGRSNGGGTKRQRRPSQQMCFILSCVTILAFGYFAFFVARPTSAKNRTTPARVRTRGRKKITTTSTTAVVLSTEWEPSHPSTANIDAVIRSVRNNLIGLDKTSPILLALEYEEHVDNFENKYSNLWPNFSIQVIGSTKVLESLRRDFPTVEYVYQLHDDLAFAEPIDHLGLIRTMEEPPREGVSAVDYVLFRYFHSEEFWQVQKRCSRHGETYKIPVRKSKNTKAIDSKIANSSDSAVKHGISFLCESCLYFQKINHLAKLDWYSKLVVEASSRIGSGGDNIDDNINVKSAPPPTEEHLQSEVHRICKRREHEGESTGLYLYYDSRLFDKHVVQHLESPN
jgi:hypothetical protein